MEPTALMAVSAVPRGGVWAHRSADEGPGRALRLKQSAAIRGETTVWRPDGRFLMIMDDGAALAAAPLQIVVVQHFDEELKRLVPTK